MLVAARRAKQLQDGAPPLIRTSSTHPLTIAIEEIAQGKVGPGAPEPEMLPIVPPLEEEEGETEEAAELEAATDAGTTGPADADDGTEADEEAAVADESESEEV